jgi:hypothetical protein
MAKIHANVAERLVKTDPEPDPFPTAAREPEPPSKLPEGVQMHDAQLPPQLPVPPEEQEHVRRDPPPGWQGSFERCGSCGDFLPDLNPCARCFKGSAPTAAHNMMIATPTKAVAR